MAQVFNSPSKYVQGPNALSELGEYVAALGSKALVIITASGIRRVGDKIQSGFASVDATADFEEFGGECCQTEINRLCDIVENGGYDVVIGVGGGKALDTAKAVAITVSYLWLFVLPLQAPMLHAQLFRLFIPMIMHLRVICSCARTPIWYSWILRSSLLRLCV